jgi:hypothetical protein
MFRRYITLTALLLPAVLLACQVPVFRYALERWEPDEFRVIVLHDQPLPEAQQTLIKTIEAASWTEEGHANFNTWVINAAENKSKVVQDLFKKHGKPGDARLMMLYPGVTGVDEPFWVGALTKETAAAVADSPMRKQIRNLILNGKSTVWVVVNSGNPEKDSTAVKHVTATSKDIVKQMALPDGVITQDELLEQADEEDSDELIDFSNPNILRSTIPLKIDPATVTLNRDNPKEQLLLKMLTVLDGQNVPKDEPLLYAVFGRGRSIGPLVGKEIVEDNIWDMANYIGGACSCEVKRDNPGVDLLMQCDWDTALEESRVIEDKDLPPLVGSAALVAEDDGETATDEVDAKAVVAAPATAAAQDSGGMGRNLTIVIILMLVLITAGSLGMLRKPEA